VFENRVSRRIFGPKRDEVTGGWKKLRKSRRMRWAGHVARMGKKRNAYRILMGKPGERDHWEDQGVGGWIISKLILGCVVWT
jgi:hypothetical protein